MLIQGMITCPMPTIHLNPHWRCWPSSPATTLPSLAPQAAELNSERKTPRLLTTRASPSDTQLSCLCSDITSRPSSFVAVCCSVCMHPRSRGSIVIPLTSVNVDSGSLLRPSTAGRWRIRSRAMSRAMLACLFVCLVRSAPVVCGGRRLTKDGAER